MAKRSGGKTKSQQSSANGRRTRMASDMEPAEDMEPAGGMTPAGGMGPADDMGEADDMTVAGAAGGAPIARSAFPTAVMAPRGLPKASGLIELARKHVGEKYVLGARAPMGNANWRGPWDCAEFVSWCHFQHAGILFGTRPRNDPMRADAYTGYWAEQAEAVRCTIPWEDAAAIEGAALLRKPAPGMTGHIVLADGRGGTIEAHSSRTGVIAGKIGGRRWDYGILVPGIDYFRSDDAMPSLPPPGFLLRLTTPLMRGDNVRRVQQRLTELAFPVGAIDGIYGPQTAHAVEMFQASNGLVADGEIGDATSGVLFG